jgi:hypothetical protein
MVQKTQYVMVFRIVIKSKPNCVMYSGECTYITQPWPLFDASDPNGFYGRKVHEYRLREDDNIARDCVLRVL